MEQHTDILDAKTCVALLNTKNNLSLCQRCLKTFTPHRNNPRGICDRCLMAALLEAQRDLVDELYRYRQEQQKGLVKAVQR